MVRIGISVEGLTEEIFIEKLLAPYLAQKNVFISPIPMGGDVSIDRAKSELKKIANNFEYVTTLYDFYGFKKKSLGENKESLENKLMQSVHDGVRPKLIPYIQMYEFEGILFSCPASMERVLNEAGVAEWAQGVLDAFGGNPEMINNSVETAPSKRLNKDTGYRKTTHGPNIAEEIGIDKIRKMCLGFDAWLTTIEGLAK
jgi:Domain of unknown function (DUF4276)